MRYLPDHPSRHHWRRATWGGYVPARNGGKHRGCRRCLVRRELRRWNGSKPPPVAAGEITSVKRQPPAAPHLSCAHEGKWRRAKGAGGRGRLPAPPRGGAAGLALLLGLRPPSSAEPGGRQRPVGACRSLPAARAGGRGRPCSSPHGSAREVCKGCGKSSASWSSSL